MQQSADRKTRILRLLPYLGIFGSALISLAVLVGALVYSGEQGERYSLMNHFISELGRIGVSRAAWLFNAAMVASGILFIPFCAGISLRLKSVLGWLAFAAGFCASVACAGVGFFPMNNLPFHIAFATWFFRLGLLMVVFYGIAILAQPRGAPRLPRAASLISLPAVAAFTAFLSLAGMLTGGGANPLDISSFSARRAPFWPLALLEWSIFFTTVLWFLAMGIVEVSSLRYPFSAPMVRPSIK